MIAPPPKAATTESAVVAAVRRPKKASVFAGGDEISHPRIPSAARDRCHALINRKRGDEHLDPERAANERCSRCPNEKRATDGRTKHTDIPANAPAFYQQDRRYL